MGRFHPLVREPLVHFLVIGVVVFAVFELRQEGGSELENRILVTDGQVEQFSAQFQRTRLRPPTETELTGLIEGYVRDEVYYREAVAMGLDLNDGIVRQRMRLKLEFLLEDLTAEEAATDEHLELLRQIASMLDREEVRQRLRQAPTNESLYQVVVDVQNGA